MRWPISHAWVSWITLTFLLLPPHPPTPLCVSHTPPQSWMFNFEDTLWMHDQIAFNILLPVSKLTGSAQS